MMKRVNFVIAGNQFLKSQIIPYNANVEVIPTSIDLSHYSLKKGYHLDGPITIGWLGNSGTLKYLRPLLPTLEKMFNGYPHFQLKIVCDQFLDSSYLPIIKKRWFSEEEEADLKSFDIGIMPLSDDLWSRGKCGFKIVQYYGVGVPVVCTPVGANRDLVEDGWNGFWAQSEEEWTRPILKLMQDDGLRREMGLKGRKTVEKSYSLEINAPRLLNVLKRVAQG
jgi:glycosyltransferase involved in cell wall biosynthesis